MINALLFPLAMLYALTVRIRNYLYDKEILSSVKLPAPVISVGNISAGGTGKTPFAEYIAELLHKTTEKKIFVLSRGYKRPLKTKEPILVSDGKEIFADWKTAGDEPMLLAENLLGVAGVAVSQSRVKGGEFAIKKFGAQALVLDDGFQHRRIKRALDVVLIDGKELLGNEKLLPYGYLREHLSGLARADCIIFTRTPDGMKDRAGEWLHKKAPGMRCFFAQIVAKEIVWSKDAKISKDRVGAFCGIANQERFFQTLAQMGYEVKFFEKFSDHHRYSREDLQNIVRDAKSVEAEALITTQKDWVKVKNFEWEIPVGYPRLKAEVEEEEEFIKFLQKVLK